MSKKTKVLGVVGICLFTLIPNSLGKAQDSQNSERGNKRGRLEQSIENSKVDLPSSKTLKNSASSKIKIEKAKLKAEAEKIIENYEKHGEYVSAAKLALRFGDNERASLDYEKAGQIDEALKQTKDENRKLKILTKSGRISEAAEKAKTLEDRAEIYYESGKFEEAGRIYEELGDKAKAENKLDSMKIYYTKATEIYQKLGWIDSKAQIFIKMGDYPSAVETYSSSGWHFLALDVLDDWREYIKNLSKTEITTQTLKSKPR